MEKDKNSSGLQDRDENEIKEGQGTGQKRREKKGYAKRDPSSPREAGCLLSAAGGSCRLDPLHFILQLLSLFLASPASAMAAPVRSQ